MRDSYYDVVLAPGAESEALGDLELEAQRLAATEPDDGEPIDVDGGGGLDSRWRRLGMGR